MDDALSRWLQLREPVDAVARSERLTRIIADALAGTEPVRVLDLATGTGANLRYLAPHLPRLQHWLVVDRDPAVLARLPALTSSWGVARQCDVRTHVNGCGIRGERLECHVEMRQLDLGSLTDEKIFAGRHLVTASALLDLVSQHWLSELAARCRAAGAAALFTITYNGWSCCSPSEPEDDVIRDLLNRHQHTDKGLGGAAAGPEAVESVIRCFSNAGYRVETDPSDWSLGTAEHELQRRLIEGWAEAATEMRADLPMIASWRDRRIAHVDAGRSRIVVGHQDVAALVPRR
jgi:hypothetical protein